MHVPSLSGIPCCGLVAVCGAGYLNCGRSIEEEREEAVKVLDICNETADSVLSSKEVMKMQCSCFCDSCIILNKAWGQYVLGGGKV